MASAGAMHPWSWPTRRPTGASRRCRETSTRRPRRSRTWDAADADAWRDLVTEWRRVGDPFIATMLAPMPPIRAGLRLAVAIGARELPRFARFALLPARRMAAERFGGEGAALLLCGLALHTDVALDAPGGGVPAWMLAGIGTERGFPVPEGGAQRLTAALVSRLEARGGTVRCGARVAEIVVRDRRAVAVRLADGDEIAAPRGVLADVGAPALYRDLVGEEHLPARLLADLAPLRVRPRDVQGRLGARRRGAVARRTRGARRDRPPARLARPRRRLHRGARDRPDPEPSLRPPGADERRGPEPLARGDRHRVGVHPRAPARAGRRRRLADRRVDAGGVRDRSRTGSKPSSSPTRRGSGPTIAARHVSSPTDLEAADANLVGGAVGGGTASLYQQLVFRPTPGLGRAETPIRGLFLASASAHPGPGVHGACGNNAARAAIAADRIRRLTRTRAS